MKLHTLSLGALDTNCYIVQDDNGRGMIIDPADQADVILALIEKEHLSIDAVVLTHAHFDHMLAAKELCAVTNATLCVGARDEAALADPMRNLSGLFQICQPIRLKADRTLVEGDELIIGDVSLTVLETPGHTPGCICLVGEGVLFSGDTLFYSSIGRLDFPGGDVSAMQASLQRLATLPAATVVYPGHGEPTTIGREATYNPYMR